MGPKIHAEQRAAALPADLAEEYMEIGRWAEALAERHGSRIRLRVIDVLSAEGFLMALRHRLGRFPAFIVDGRHARGDLREVASTIEERLEEQGT